MDYRLKNAFQNVHIILNPNVRQNRIPMYAISSIIVSVVKNDTIPLHNIVNSLFIYC